MYLSTEKFIISTTFNFMKWACRNTSSAIFCMFSFFTGFYATLTFISFNMTMQVKTWKKSHIFFLIIKISFVKIILFSSFTFYQIGFFSTKRKNSINHNYRYVAWKSFYEIYLWLWRYVPRIKFLGYLKLERRNFLRNQKTT